MISSKPCRFGANCNRSHCSFSHPPIVCKYGNRCRNSYCTYLHENTAQQFNSIHLIEHIERLFTLAKEQQTDFSISMNDDDDEDLQMNEFKLREKEFRTAIAHLDVKFRSIVSSAHNHHHQLEQIQRELQREFKYWQSCLPIYSRRSEIIDRINQNQVLIIKADTGSGKSTQTVQYLCDAHFATSSKSNSFSTGKIICTQPRKLAVRSLAARVAEEYGCQIGEEIGYQVGGDRPITSRSTKVKFVTDTLFLNEYNRDRCLQNYSIVIVDEAHERKIDTDIVFGIMKRCLRQRKDLKLIIMSATLDVDLLYKYFSPDFRCEKIEIGGRTYPIEDIYLDEDVENYVSTSVTKAIEIHQSDESGDILVFLTGQDEIDEALAELNQKLSHDQTFVGLPLHGKLTEDENAKIFEKMPNIRKIIFSTNVAETSVTIDGIRHVIESGMVKEKMWDEKRKMQILKIGQITKSSVKQRRGRAGRTSPGKCYHLYSIDTYEAMDTCSRAEILCTQPTIAILKLKNLNIDEIESFEWLESPSNSNIRDAYQTLIWLDALDHQGQLTELGRLMAELNIDPKLTTMLYKAKQLNCLFHALVLAAMLTVSQNIWWTNKDQKSKEIAANIRAQLSHPTGDHMTLINLYFNWNSFCYQNRSKKLQYDWCRKHSVNSKSLQMAQEFIREKGKQLECRFDFNENQVELNDELVNRLLQSMTAGHFLNLGISNGPLRAGYQIISAFPSETNESIVARIFRTSTLCLNEQMPKYILFNELVNLNGTNYITILSSIDLGWLRTVSNDWFDRIHGENLHRISYENLTLENIGSSLLRAFVGKHNTHLNMIEETTQSIIDVNFQQSKLTIWAREKNFANVKQIVEKRIREEREKLLTETEEMQIIGRTRIVMGSGGVSQFVLVEDEFIRIILTKLSPTIDQETIENLCQPFGQIRKIDFLRSNHDGACVAVTYSTIEQARNACQQLNHSQSIAATGSYLKTDAFIGKQTYRLKAIWYLTAGKGTAMIGFNQVQSAIDACQIFKRLNYQCHYERSTDLPTLKVVFYIAQSRRKAFVHFPTYDQAIEFVAKIGNPLEVRLAHNQFARPGSVLCQGFTCEFDEEDIRDHFREHSTITDVQVLRGTPAQRFEKPDSADEELRQIFSRYKSFQSDSITFNSKIVNGRLEAYIEFLDRDDLQQAIADLNGQLGLIGNGKIRLSERILPRRESTKKTKENEYVIRFHSLDKTHDRYDLMKIIKDNQLHDHVKYVTVFRQKLDRTNMSNEDVKEFYKEEQQTGLECLRQMFDEEKDLFNSTPDCQIVSCFPNGTVTAIVQFSDPVDVLTATQTFSNRRIEMFLVASKLRLIPTITHEIFINSALTKVMTDKIQQSIEFIREKFKRVFIRELTPKNTDKTTSNRKILIDSDDLEQVTMAKIQFDNLLKGFEYKFFDQPEKIKLLFDRAGLSFLSKLQNETQTYIWSNQSNCSIRIYGNDRSVVDAKKRIDQYIRDLLKNETFTITLNIPTDSSDFIRQVLKESSNYQTDFGKNLSIEIQTLVVERQIRITGKREQDVIQCEQQIQEHWSNLFSTVAKQLHLPNTNECPICFNTANYSLQTCGHRFCLNCLRHELTMKFDTTLSNTSLRIKCLMNNCDSVFLLRDIKTIINAADMKKLARASFQAYLKSDEDIVQCLGIDCKQVYRKSKHPQLYFCDSCCKMYCVKCEVEYHTGLTCSTYQTLRNWKQEEPLAASNIGNLGYKPCPECKQIIDRYDGCNAVKCKCGIAFCWLCLKTDPNDIHSHFHDRYSTCYNKLFWTMENARQ